MIHPGTAEREEFTDERESQRTFAAAVINLEAARSQPGAHHHAHAALQAGEAGGAGGAGGAAGGGHARNRDKGALNADASGLRGL